MKKTIIALITALVAVCLLAGCSVDYQKLNLEIINRSSKDAKAIYFYPDGSELKYNNIVEHFTGEDKKEILKDGVLENVSKSGFRLIGYLVRPVADSYTIEFVFTDDTTLKVSGLKFVPDRNGHIPNSIIIRSATDPSDSLFEYDNNEDVLNTFKENLEAATPMDKFLGHYTFWAR